MRIRHSLIICCVLLLLSAALPAAAQGEPIAFDTLIRRDVTDTSHTYTFTFEGEAGMYLLVSREGKKADDTRLAPVYTLSDPNGNVVDAESVIALNDIYRLERAGAYTVTIGRRNGADGTETGFLELVLRRGIPVEVGARVESTLEQLGETTVGQTRLYVFAQQPPPFAMNATFGSVGRQYMEVIVEGFPEWVTGRAETLGRIAGRVTNARVDIEAPTDPTWIFVRDLQPVFETPVSYTITLEPLS